MTFNFAQTIQKFNLMYGLPVAATPTLDVGVPLAKRLAEFKCILTEELSEIDDIVEALPTATAEETLTNLADLLGDLQIYCASEMAKFGLPLEPVLAIIMDSNFSKLGADGLPIYDERGKVLKGPGHWKPEPQLSEMLATYARSNEKPAHP